MSGYEILDPVEFGRQLIKSQDLDPTYVVLWSMEWSKEKQCKFLLSYWCFYHFGTAAWITSQPNYWTAFTTAAGSKDYPRASERRHFRGKAATDAVLELLRRNLTPSELISGLNPNLEAESLLNVMQRVQEWRGFGSWISFKVADMLERLNLAKISFQPDDVFRMYESPRLGAEYIAKQAGWAGDPYKYAYNLLNKKLGHMLAPPRFERKINIQEIETVLCKYLSHVNGRYKIGKDIHEVRESIGKYPDLYLSQELIAAGHRGGLW